MRVRLVVFVLTLCAVHASAQTTATLTGFVTSNAQPVSGAKVTVTSPQLQGERSTSTTPSGAYLLAALPPGVYDVAFTAPSMKDVQRSATLGLNQTVQIDVMLQPTASADITVVAETPSVIQSEQVATTLALTDIEKLPLQRNQLATAQFAPGVTANVLQNGQLAISGGPGYDNLVTVNGVVVNENTRGQIRPMYVEDAIYETTVLTGAINAQYGRFTGGVVNTITKSGSNDLSASLRDSLSNPRWSAVSPANEEREDNLNHVLEGTLGGPLLRERIWFFTAARWAKNDMVRQTIAIPAVTTGAVQSPASPQLSYTEGNDQKRYEAKVTARVAENHNVVGSWFAIDTQGDQSRFANNIYDAASLTTRDEPESLYALRYDGIFGPRVLLEGQASRRTYELSSGAATSDIAGGTVLLDRANQNARFNAPTLCGFCDAEERNNDDYLAKAEIFLDGLGTHDLIAGIDRFTERHLLDDHQSGSDFSLFVTRAQYRDGIIYPVITPSNANGGGSFIRWNPVLTPARENELRTDSLFVNDDWNLDSHWNVSLGVRYDRNHAADSDGLVTANDSRLSPRLAVQFDPRGDGRHHVGASYGEYTSRVADTIASINQSAGSSASIDFAYRGPGINANALTVPLPQAIAMVFNYFNTTQGGTDNRTAQNLRANGLRDIPGYTAYFDGSLSSPYVREWTLGYATQIGAHGFARADLISRDWRDFYALEVTTATRHETTPLGIAVDLARVTNTNDIERTYRGVQLQARWNRSPLDLGVHYTWSKLRGNDEGETMNGAIPNTAPSLYYPELMDYERNNPVGYLRGDQRHRLRAWAGLELGDFGVSLLETFDSGQAYSISAPINVTRYTGAPANPGYASIPNGRYFFTDRGALRTGDVTSTNLAVRWAHRFLGVEVFAQGDLLNVFDEDAIADPQRLGSGVSTAANSTTLQPFDPRTTTPVEGTHYTLAANFGQALNNQAYQAPRTYRISLGLRF